MLRPMIRVFYDAKAAGGGDPTASDPDTSTDAAPAPATWDEYLDTLPAEEKTKLASLVATHNASLLNAVKATREERDNLAGELRKAAKDLEEGSAAKTKLLEQAAELEKTNRRADFMEEAVVKQCNNPKAAYAIAVTENLFDKNNKPKWDNIKELAPQLFGSAAPNPLKKPKGNAGDGAGDPPTVSTVSDFIRQQRNRR